MKKIFGVLGYPVEHSLSPVVHNAAIKTYGIDAEYVRFSVKPEELGQFMESLRKENIQGLSVTMPHKEKIISFLDGIDEDAKEIGAVNTIKRDGEKLIGYNTDAYGVLKALSEVTSLTGKNIGIIGAGGAALAIVYACKKAGAKVTIYNRTEEKALEIAKKFHLRGRNLEDFEQDNLQTDILIQTTPVGMWPKTEESIVPKKFLRKEMIAMDIIYNPFETQFLKDAKQKGCITVSGIQMFLYQAMNQFEIWFEQKVPKDIMKIALQEQV